MSLVPGQVVEWNVGGRSVRLPLRWIRLECPCHDCRVGQTAERRWVPLDDTDFEPTAVTTGASGIVVDWASGHRTTFSAEQLRASLATRDRARTDVRLIGLTGPRRFEHDRVVADAGYRVEYLRFLRDEGAAILAGTPSVPGQLEHTLAALGLPVREMFDERIHDVVVDPQGYNIAHTTEALPPHSDFASYTHPPSGQVLHMLANECGGGDSILVDGWSVVEAMRVDEPVLVAALSEVAVGFRQFASRRESFARSPLVVLDPAGRVRAFRYSNQLMQPLEPEHPRFELWLDAYIALSRRLHDPANQYRFRLGDGDALFVHGHRMLHARTAFVPDGRRHLQDAYYEFDDVLAVIDRLTGLATAKAVTS